MPTAAPWRSGRLWVVAPSGTPILEISFSKSATPSEMRIVFLKVRASSTRRITCGYISVTQVVDFLLDGELLLLERRKERGIGQRPGRLGPESLIDTGMFGMKSGNMG
jgi:hypothetical protein